MEEKYKRIAKLLLNSKKCIALTGAGISAESGIPTFRSKEGMWEKYDPAVYASIDAFHKDPSKYWTIRGDFIRNYDDYKPNPAHLTLAELEKMGVLTSVITQNIDGLHSKAGSKQVIELHGTLRRILCMQCSKEYTAPNVPDGTPPLCDECGGVLKPNTVLFGEPLPAKALSEAQRECSTCDIMLLIGTSTVVYPVAALPKLVKENGGQVIELNLENAFPFTDYFIGEKAGTAMPQIMAELKKIKNNN
ncbi:MAG: NAD-dependent deacylase [Candidatus Aminicenantes bacterium]|nr:NAD-dependent deacylase [Candidatus Aminicenantes bacterium]